MTLPVSELCLSPISFYQPVTYTNTLPVQVGTWKCILNMFGTEIRSSSWKCWNNLWFFPFSAFYSGAASSFLPSFLSCSFPLFSFPLLLLPLHLTSTCLRTVYVVLPCSSSCLRSLSFTSNCMIGWNGREGGEGRGSRGLPFIRQKELTENVDRGQTESRWNNRCFLFMC